MKIRALDASLAPANLFLPRERNHGKNIKSITHRHENKNVKKYDWPSDWSYIELFLSRGQPRQKHNNTPLSDINTPFLKIKIINTPFLKIE